MKKFSGKWQPAPPPRKLLYVLSKSGKTGKWLCSKGHSRNVGHLVSRAMNILKLYNRRQYLIN